MATILGTLRDELGNFIVGCRMSFIEQATARRFQITTSGGANPGGYSLSLPPGIFRVLLKPAGTFERDLGSITVYTDSPDGTLNSFLNAKNTDTRPKALRQFEALAKQATDSAGQASDSETAARDAAGQAAISEQTAINAATTATTAAGTATGAAQQAATSEQHARQSEKNAAASEASVSQIVTDITVTGETVKQAIQTQGQHFVDMAHTEATNASQSAQDAQTASQAAQQAKTEAQAALKDTLAASQSAKDAESNALKASLEAQDAAKTPIITDKVTITGDGKTRPLALGPGEMNGIGGYVMAYSGGGISVGVTYGTTIPGNRLMPSGYAPNGADSQYGRNSYTSPDRYNKPLRLMGTWRLCCEGAGKDISVGLYQRIA
ncbi:hypothetical protein CSM81_07485 [Salmonella enterica subsp. enterica serovar Infantis]|nr:hypothetical protein [Salmonella enterica subsp. enterica serovar Infantis]